MQNYINNINNEFKNFNNSINNAQGWFDEMKTNGRKTTNVQKPTKFESGKLYSFEYKCDEESYITNPLIVCLEADKYLTAINLQHLPTNVARLVVAAIRDSYYIQYNAAMIKMNNNAIKQDAIKFAKIFLEALNKKFSSNFAIRNYNYNNIKNPFVFCYEDWSKAICTRDPKFVGQLNENLNNRNYLKYHTTK